MPFFQAAGMTSQCAKKASMVFELRNDLTHQVQEVVLENANNMEAIGDDARIGEPAPHQRPVSTGEVDADHLNLIAALQTAQEGRQFLLAASLAQCQRSDGSSGRRRWSQMACRDAPDAHRCPGSADIADSRAPVRLTPSKLRLMRPYCRTPHSPYPCHR